MFYARFLLEWLLFVGLLAVLMFQVKRFVTLRKGHGTATGPELERLRAAALPADLAELVQGPRNQAVARIRQESGLSVRDSLRVYDLAKAGQI